LRESDVVVITAHMRTKDVRQWVGVSSSTSSADSPYDSDDEMKPDGNGGAHKADQDLSSLQDWDSFLAGAEKKSRSASVKERRHLLEVQLPSLERNAESSLSPSQQNDILVLLLATYSRYQDKESRSAAQSVASHFIEVDFKSANEGTLAQNAVEWLQKEVVVVCKPTKDGYFPSSSVRRANLVSWISLVFQTIVKIAKENEVQLSSLALWNGLVTSFALAYEAVAIDRHYKPALTRNATAAVRRRIRSVSVSFVLLSHVC
jgi:hypothetical protein